MNYSTSCFFIRVFFTKVHQNDPIYINYVRKIKLLLRFVELLPLFMKVLEFFKSYKQFELELEPFASKLVCIKIIRFGILLPNKKLLIHHMNMI